MYRTDVSATSFTSGKKCLYRLDLIVCDASYMTVVGRRCYSVIICMVHTNRFAGVVVIVIVRIVPTINILLSRSRNVSREGDVVMGIELIS